jgi:MoaA/NifB/PqqE/SkfB family radical SAM enzyme
MCDIWKYPSRPLEEIGLSILCKLPEGFDNLNLTGGEPTLRADLVELCEQLHPKARKLEISTNGLHPERLEPIIRRFPDIKIRVSLEGFQQTNDRIRGEEDGFERKVRGLLRLKELGGTDLGFATVIQDDNTEDLVALYNFTKDQRIELATSALHNAFQFHKGDNFPYDRVKVAKKIEELIGEMLKGNSVKSWFRAYLNLGLIRKVLGQDRLIPCTAGKDFIFIDPWADVFACNVRPDLRVGNLNNQSWDEIIDSRETKWARKQVEACTQNCWMVTTARTAMRNPYLPFFPKVGPLAWVVENKLRVTLGMPICFEKHIDYSNVAVNGLVKPRKSYLGSSVKRKPMEKNGEHYTQFGPFDNR